MITIEDLLEELETILQTGRIGNYRKWVNPVTSPADRKFLQDLASRTRNGGKFSTKQAFIAKKIISKYARLFGDERPEQYIDATLILNAEQVIAICENPVYRNAPYQSTEIPREVRHLGNAKLGFKCKFAPQIIERIKALKDTAGNSDTPWPRFDKTHRLWVVDVTENNLEKVMLLIKKFGFKFDDEVVQFLTDCENAKTMKSSATVDDDSVVVVVQGNELLAGWINDIIRVEETVNV